MRRCQPSFLTMLAMFGAAVASVSSLPIAEAGGAACRCEVLLSKLDAEAIPENLKVPGHPAEVIAAMDNGDRPITALAFLNYGQFLAVAEGGPPRKGAGPAGRVQLYDLSGKSPQFAESLDMTTDYVAVLSAHSTQPKLLIAASVRWDQGLQSWKKSEKNWGQSSKAGDFSDWWIKAAAISPDGRTLATGAGGVRLWSLDEGNLQREQELPGTAWAISAIAFSPDGKQLVAGTGSSHSAPEDGELIIWSLKKSPAVIARAAVSEGDVTDIVVQPAGQIVAADQGGDRRSRPTCRNRIRARGPWCGESYRGECPIRRHRRKSPPQSGRRFRLTAGPSGILGRNCPGHIGRESYPVRAKTRCNAGSM
jgi:WD40 repeat protein